MASICIYDLPTKRFDKPPRVHHIFLRINVPVGIGDTLLVAHANAEDRSNEVVVLPYLLLGAAGVAMVVVTAIGWPSPVRVWIYVVTGGAISVGDLFVTGLFNLYEYKPGLLRGRPDNYLGVLIAECLFVPAVFSLLSAAPRRLRAWLFALTCVPMVGLELLFYRLQVYEHHGWRFTFTFVLFAVYGLLASFAVTRFEQRGYAFWQRLLLVGSSVYFAMNLWGLLPFGMLRLVTIHLWLLANPEFDLTLSSLLLHAIPFTVIGLTGVWTGWIRRPLWAATTVAGLFLWLLLQRRLGIYHSRPPWHPLLGSALVVSTHLGLSQLDRWFARRTPSATDG